MAHNFYFPINQAHPTSYRDYFWQLVWVHHSENPRIFLDPLRDFNFWSPLPFIYFDSSPCLQLWVPPKAKQLWLNSEE
jgi:hypothetical protein